MKVVTLGVALALGTGMEAHAQPGQSTAPLNPPMGSGMPQGMMGNGGMPMMNMMQQMSRMMESCDKMMENHMQHPDTQSPQSPQQDHKG
jgi:hypothetical protein